MQYVELKDSEVEAIKREEARLRGCTKKWLVDELLRHRRVYDARELTKGDVVFELLRVQFGARAVASAYRPFAAQEVAWVDGKGRSRRRVCKTASAWRKLCEALAADGLQWVARPA